jgi:hypothetical protein
MISWLANSETNIQNYVVQRAESEVGPWTNVTTVSSPTITYTDTGLKSNTKYYYRVVAVNTENLHSDPSQVVSITTEKETDGDGGFPMVLVILLVIIILVVILLLFFLMKKKGKA